MSYDNFAQTFSNSRKNHPWPELDAIIADIREHNFESLLDIGCGNGRFLEEWEKYDTRKMTYFGIDNSEGMIAEARKIHPNHDFEVCSMESILNFEFGILNFESILFLASFHHLETREARLDTLTQAKRLLTQNGRIYMTNWNLRDQERYIESHRGNGDYDIKIGEYSRYYHGFTPDELSELFEIAGLHVIDHAVFPGGRNILSILTH